MIRRQAGVDVVDVAIPPTNAARILAGADAGPPSSLRPSTSSAAGPRAYSIQQSGVGVVDVAVPPVNAARILVGAGAGAGAGSLSSPRESWPERALDHHVAARILAGAGAMVSALVNGARSSATVSSRAASSSSTCRRSSRSYPSLDFSGVNGDELWLGISGWDREVSSAARKGYGRPIISFFLFQRGPIATVLSRFVHSRIWGPNQTLTAIWCDPALHSAWSKGMADPQTDLRIITYIARIKAAKHDAEPELVERCVPTVQKQVVNKRFELPQEAELVRVDVEGMANA